VKTSAEEVARAIIGEFKKSRGGFPWGRMHLYQAALQRNHPLDYQESEEYQKVMEMIFPEEWGKSGS